MIAQDKLKHLAVGIFFSLLIPFIGIYSLLICVILAFGKEVYDYLSRNGTPETLDAVFTIAPTLLTYLIYNLIK
jgi:hypothetical protein